LELAFSAVRLDIQEVVESTDSSLSSLDSCAVDLSFEYCVDEYAEFGGVIVDFGDIVSEEMLD
jgi:hypothetical protein